MNVIESKRFGARKPSTLCLSKGEYSAVFVPTGGVLGRFRVQSEKGEDQIFEFDRKIKITSEAGRELFGRPSVELSLSSRNTITEIKLQSNPEK